MLILSGYSHHPLFLMCPFGDILGIYKHKWVSYPSPTELENIVRNSLEKWAQRSW